MKAMKKISYCGLLLAAVGLVACGGGGGGGLTSPQAIAIDGIAATGAPMASASVSVFDATGSLVVEGVVVGADGKYSLSIPAGKVAPYTFVVDDGVDKLVSILGSSNSTTVNINQITDLVAAKLSPSGNPLSLSTEIAKGSVTATTSAITSASTVVQTALKPLFTAANVSSFDPFSVKFATNGTGVDKVLDMLDIKITPAGTTSNVEVTVKGAMDEDQGANSLSQFALGATVSAAIPTLPDVPAGDVVADGTSPLIKNLLDKMTACYALPKVDRVGATGTTAAAVVATPCKEIFIGQNPVTYKHGGSLVSSTQHFSGIFNPSAVGVVFDRPQYFGTVKTDAPINGPKAGDMLIGYRWVDSAGNYQYERTMVRKNVTNGRLEVVGNQYLHDGGVGSYAQKRTNVRNDDMSYYSVGYTPGAFVYWVSGVAKVVGSGKPITDLVVTTPKGNNLKLCPKTGFSFLVFAKDPSLTCNAVGQQLGGTNFLRLRSEYVNNTTSTHPRTKDTSLAFASPDVSETELEGQVSTKPWTFVYNFADNTTATQYHRPARRAYSIGEFKAVPLPTLTTAKLDALKASASVTAISGNGYGGLPASGFELAWQGAFDDLIAAKKPVPVNAAPMTAVRIFGASGLGAGPGGGFSGSFEDRVSIRSTLRAFTITCPSGDPQCATGTTQYAATSKVTGTDLYSRSSDGVEYVNFYTMTFLAP
ncbi:hypothetical protein [Limnohabitans sp. B9-3]|uniref:hypothetical protein n=1 Tax=Limnohabitans sp. B9-3 TaxID=1100707 RepID=UPI000C1F495A|nr:hypothetical protein [Limnohabitans sp. B9-3]PIT75337.1 hypothetical protein B9Z42_08230 [Limnohabitans sp. B9-3]